MTLPSRLAALALAAATFGTERGRGCLGSVLITLGSELLPHEPHDPTRDKRITERIMAELGRLTTTPASRNGHTRPPL